MTEVIGFMGAQLNHKLLQGSNLNFAVKWFQTSDLTKDFHLFSSTLEEGIPVVKFISCALIFVTQNITSIVLYFLDEIT